MSQPAVFQPRHHPAVDLSWPAHQPGRACVKDVLVGGGIDPARTLLGPPTTEQLDLSAVGWRNHETHRITVVSRLQGVLQDPRRGRPIHGPGEGIQLPL